MNPLLNVAIELQSIMTRTVVQSFQHIWYIIHATLTMLFFDSLKKVDVVKNTASKWISSAIWRQRSGFRDFFIEILTLYFGLASKTVSFITYFIVNQSFSSFGLNLFAIRILCFVGGINTEIMP